MTNLKNLSLQKIIKPVNYGKHKREIGRYWASDLYSIKGKYLNTANFFKEKVIDETGATNIFFGVALENELTRKLKELNIDIQPQFKKELKFGDITLVVKPDFVSDICIECKCPVKPLENIPERYKYQLEAEYRATLKTTYLLSFQRPSFRMFKYEQSDERWLEIQELLINFNNRLIKKYGK